MTAKMEPAQESPTNTNTDNHNDSTQYEQLEHHPLVIVGGGIGGLVLALCLDQIYNHPAATTDDCDVTASNHHLSIHVYESTCDYRANAGGAIGLYPNGLRVLRHLSKTHPNTPTILQDVRNAGCDYLYRRWMRHDGMEVAVAREDELLPDIGHDVEKIENGTNPGEDDDDERSIPSATSGESSNTSTVGRPRGDSITSQDTEGERANRRPRGGSFNSLKNPFQNLTIANRTSGISTATSNDSRSPRRSSVRIVETELLSLGIRRWKYQQVLYEACIAAGIHVHFGKRLQTVTSLPSSSTDSEDSEDVKTVLHFKDGSQITTSLLIGADGVNSKVRNYVTNPQSTITEEYVPAYTGVTCLMGIANVPRIRGICFPSSATTKCHACYYPTRAPRESDDPNDYEQVFQIYFPSPVERPDTWRTLTPVEAKEECQSLAKKLRSDGWDEEFLKPLESETLTGVLRVGLRSREGLDCWHVGGSGDGENADSNNDNQDSSKQSGLGRAVLLGDAAHPPVPYIGQGAMMAMEDAGTLSMLLGHYCPLMVKQNNDNNDGPTTTTTTAQPNFAQFSKAMSMYESLRISRTRAILGSSVQLGKTQQKRAESKLYNAWREMTIKAQVWAYGTLPVMRPGAAFDYRAMVEEALLEGGK